jgi:glucose/arabinose dehydrogenase
MTRRTIRAATGVPLAVVIALASLPVPALAMPRTPAPATLRTPTRAAGSIDADRVIGGLSQPVAFTFGPGNEVWYVEKGSGRIRVHDLDTGTDKRFAVISGVSSEGERGTLGIALHPDYPDKPFVYVYATRTDQGKLRNEILRLTDSGGTGKHLKVIFHAPASSSAYHNGGRILFGLDGMLYAIVGDGHDSANAQDTTRNDRGKILRMTAMGDAPADNPIAGSRIWAYGIRNSFGFAFDPQTGDLWETENGPECNDELNRILGGANYGWGPSETCSGRSPGDTNQDGPSPVLPKLWYTPTIAPTGIAFCERCGLGGKTNGTLLFGAYNTGEIRRVTLNGARTGVADQRVVFTHRKPVLAMEVGPGRTIYFSDFRAIYRLVRS